MVRAPSTGESGHANTVRILLNYGADPDTCGPDGQRSPLSFAAVRAASVECIQVLLENRANPNHERLQSALTVGIVRSRLSVEGKIEILQVLIHNRSMELVSTGGPDGKTALMFSAEAGEKILATALIRAAAFSDNGIAAVDLFLSRPDVDVHLHSNEKGTALHSACIALSVPIAMKLMEAGVNVNQRVPGSFGTPLIAACLARKETKARSDHFEKADRMVRLLVSRGADVRLEYGTFVFNALCAAALRLRPGVANCLIDEGAGPRRCDPLGRLPIQFAAANSSGNFHNIMIHACDTL